MRIAIFTRVLPHHSIGGMQAIAWDLARSFARSGCSVQLVTAGMPGRPEIFEDEGVKIITLPGVSWQRYGSAWWKGSRAAFERLAPECDAVLSVSAAANALLPLRRRYQKIPFVMQAHGTSVGEVLSKWASRTPRNLLSSIRNAAWIVKDMRAYPRYDAIVAVGERVMSDMRLAPIRWSLPENSVQLIRNGIDTELFCADASARSRVRERLGWDERDRVVVSVSRLHKQKGLDLSLDGFAALAARVDRARYVIVGDGPEKAALESHARTLGLCDKVHFVGAVTRESMPEWIQAADAMLFTTTHVEVGLPLNVLEALAVGLPCVVSRHLLAELTRNAPLAGVAPRDATSIAAALELALTRAPARVSALPLELSLAACANSYLDIFQRLSSQRAERFAMAGDHV
jgi:glycosyltransferase involved in cell wall biosynthesis